MTKDELPDLGIIITFRATHASRVASLTRVLSHYGQLSGAEIVVIEQDAAPATLPAFPMQAKRLFVFNPGPFNKSWGFNVGARQIDRGLLLFADADLLLAPKALLQSVRLCRSRVAAANPFDRLIDLDETESARICAGNAAPDWARGDGSNTRRDNEVLNFCGGAFMIRRDVFLTIGGFDERFLGWGGEDDAMAFKLRRSSQVLGQVEGSTAQHLWHAQDDSTTFAQPHYASNLAMLKSLASIDDAAFRFQCEVQRQVLGHPRKYELAAMPVHMQL
jgi:N-terminal domain of galactosyltransferase